MSEQINEEELLEKLKGKLGSQPEDPNPLHDHDLKQKPAEGPDEEQLPRTMNFSWALDHLKHGRRIARLGWNGKGMYLQLLGSSIIVLSDNTRVLDMDNLRIQGAKTETGVMIHKLHDFILMKTADGYMVPWLASQTDLLAEDWSVIV